MTGEHIVVAKVKGWEPEQFLYITFKPDFSGMEQMSEPMDESELRDDLSKAGMPKSEIDSHIAHARERPI